MLTNRPWFGPMEGGGWGWVPLTWEGGVIAFACIVACLLAFGFYGRTRRTYYVSGASLSVLLLACILTGTPPG